MSSAPSSTEFDRLTDRLASGTDRLLRDADGSVTDETLADTAAELWDVVAALETLLGTVDLESLPSVVDTAALPNLVDVEELPAAIRERDPDRALDLRPIQRAIVLRELWNAVDLVDFGRELRRLRAELEDVVGPGAFDGAGDSEAAATVDSFLAAHRSDATNAAIQQQTKKRQRSARRGVVEGHAALETLYDSTGRGSGYAGRRPVSKNPTAVSSMPPGPLPDGASTRVSTVPTNVRSTRVAALPRIYDRRWRAVDGERR